MFQGHEHTGTKAVLVGLVQKDRAALEHVARLLQSDRDGGIEQAMPRCYQGGLGLGGVAVGLVEAYALVPFGDRDDPAHRSVAVAEATRNAGDFVAAGFPTPDLATEP